MKTAFFTATMLASFLAIGQTLPVITLSPTNVTVYPGNTANLTVVATGATGYQWLFNGTNIAGATSATLQVPNAQSTNCGYYMAVVKNATGWVPSQMAYLTLDYTRGASQPTACGTLPFSNTNVQQVTDPGSYPNLPPTNGIVQIIAGPQLDEMQPVGPVIHYKAGPMAPYFYNGYFNAFATPDPTTFPGQSVYYYILVFFTNSFGAFSVPSATMPVVAGTNLTVAPSNYGLSFLNGDGAATLIGLSRYDPLFGAVATNKVCVPGETVIFTVNYQAWGNCGPTPPVQWRKNGSPILNATNDAGSPCYTGLQTTFTITNVQASDAGIYDVAVYEAMWNISPKIAVSIQTTNGQGVFQSPKFSDTNFVCNLIGAAGRNYQVQWSTNLMSWNNLTTLSNLTGTVTFTNPVPSTAPQFYRTVLVPF